MTDKPDEISTRSEQPASAFTPLRSERIGDRQVEPARDPEPLRAVFDDITARYPKTLARLAQ